MSLRRKKPPQKPFSHPLQTALKTPLRAAAALRQWIARTATAAPTRPVLIVAGGFGLMAWILLVSFLWPRTVQFSFARPSCFTNPTLLPGLQTQKHSQAFAAAHQPTISIAGHTVYSQTTCINTVGAPQQNTTEHIALRPLGIPLLPQTIHVATGKLPSVDFRAPLSKPIPTEDPLVFKLTTADRVFAYRLSANGRTAPCAQKGTRLVCDTARLQLAQSASYSLSMQRVFGGRTQTAVFKQTTATVGAVQLAGSSIAAGQTVFDIPASLTLTFDKPIKSFDGAQLFAVPAGSPAQKIDTTVTSAAATLTFTFAAPLPRSTPFEARVASITATDGGHLPAPFVLAFATSGGPKVQSINIGSSRVSTSSNITLTFDTPVSGTQDLGSVIQLQIGGTTVAAAYSRSGSKVIIDPTANIPACARFTIKVLDGLQNQAGAAGNSAWSYNSRALCQVTFSVGTSVQGRAITGYRFGTGASTIVYAGNIHGNEKSANATLVSWIDYLERNYDLIPAGRTIVVIPNQNPDGYAANSRTNAHNVDLNRNFPANDWKQSVTMPGGVLNPNGGGSAPLSEPESSAFASYIASTHPRLVLYYHAAAGIVMPNNSGDSEALARQYDQKSNVNYAAPASSPQIFQYDTTGSFEDWAHQKHDIPVLLVELWDKTSDAFPKNQNAMWYMATL